MLQFRKGIALLSAIAMLLLAGCGSSGNMGQQSSSSSTGDEYMTLADHLRRINGVTISGSGNHAKVMLRGTRGISTVSRGLGTPENKTNLNLRDDDDQKQPLFVLDGQKVGRSYPDVRDMLAPGQIKSVKLLSASEASRYGSESGYGVIEITTRSSQNSSRSSGSGDNERR